MWIFAVENLDFFWKKRKVEKMAKVEIPSEWDLGAEPRYKRQNMERAMRGKIERGLIELITNSDDSYRDLEERAKEVSGKVRIEIGRRKKGQASTVIVRDKAGGMSREEMFNKLGTLGRRTSGFEEGKARRGLHGRGARDVAAFGTVHFQSIKDEQYNHMIIPPSLRCRFTESRPKKTTQEMREECRILKGNGTVVTIEVQSRFEISLHETLVKDLSRYYSIRDILSNPAREVVIVDLNKKRESRLIYRLPIGEVVFDGDFTLHDYPGAKAHLVVRRSASAFEQSTLPYREGILIKSAGAIHDCTYFGLESEPFSWRFTGELYCEFIDQLIREYDDREEANPDHPNHPGNNPIRLLDPFRDGLILEHPFIQAVYRRCKEILQPLVEKLKASEEPSKRDVVDENLSKKLDNLSKEISKIFEKKISELEEEIPSVTVDDPKIKKLGLGLYIIPPEEQAIIVGQPRTFSIVVKHFEVLDESLPVNVISSDPDNVKVRVSPVFLKKFLEDGKVGRTTFTVESHQVGTEAFIEVSYGGYNNLVLIKVIEPPLRPELPNGLSFEKSLYHLRINREKTLILWLKNFAKLNNQIMAEIVSDHRQVVIKAGGRCELRKTGAPGLFIGKVRVLGRQLKVKAEITARVEKFQPAKTHVVVEERPRISGIKFKFEPVEDDFGSVRYKWDDKSPYLLKIGARHLSIRRYLGIPTDQVYPGINSPLYHTVLAEVIAEALALRILEKQFKKEGEEGMLDYASTDAYYHKHFSEFLTVAHNNLVAESIGK
jgi:hypothetical protein